MEGNGTPKHVFAFEQVPSGMNVYIQDGQDEKTRERIGEMTFEKGKETLANQWLPALGNLVRKPVSAGIPRPQRNVFEHESETVEEHIFRAPQPIYHLERTEYPPEGGIYNYLKGLKYPTKGFPTPEACASANIFKRQFIGIIRWIARNPLAMLSLLSKKILAKFMMELASMAHITMGQYYLKPERYIKMNRELKIFLTTFIKEMGLKPSMNKNSTEIEIKKADSLLYDGFPLAIITMIEYDNMYVLRLQDMANETTASALMDNPRKEILRLLKLFQQREQRNSMNDKVISASKILLWGLYMPGIRKAWKNALQSIDWTRIQMDEADRYHALRIYKYDVLGRTFEDRKEEYSRIHDGKIPMPLSIQSTHQRQLEEKWAKERQ